MPAKKRDQPKSKENGPPITVSDRLSALLLVHMLEDRYTGRGLAALLSRAGLPYDEIASILGTTAGHVKQSVYEVESKGASLKKVTVAPAGKSNGRAGSS